MRPETEAAAITSVPAGSSATALFDQFVENYEDACGRGLALSGESRDYFAQQRIAITRRLCKSRLEPKRILDFGCGLGHSTPYFGGAFPNAALVGIDTSVGAIERARQLYGSDQRSFTTDIRDIPAASIDLVYSNGTFHHIEPDEREAIVRGIRATLRPGGLFVLWENNPWNPGTRLVMRRIPFDRDAKTLSYRTAVRLVTTSRFAVRRVSSHFYFPSWLAALRQLEPALEPIPLGAQYCVLAEAI
jgi:trans-aconitate methyltransferase